MRWALALSLALATTASRPAPPGQGVQFASICVKTGEKIAGGTKTCFYNCAGAGTEVSVPSTTVCPLTISR